MLSKYIKFTNEVDSAEVFLLFSTSDTTNMRFSSLS